MQINEWEIWHTYSTYLQVPTIDLNLAARRLVEFGIAQCAMLHNGRTYWRSQSGVGSGITLFHMEPSRSLGEAELEKDSDGNFELEEYAAEAWYQAVRFRFSEIRVFGEDNALPPPYIRCFLGQCNFVSSVQEDIIISCYPVLILYESGVLLLELRTISPDHPVSLEDFISGGVNLFQHPFKKIEVPPAISKFATRAYYHSHRKWKIHHRLALIYLERCHDKVVQNLTRIDREGDFIFELAPLSSSDEEGHYETLSSFVTTIFHTIAFIISQPRLGLSFLLRGQASIPEVGNYWVGRPHIYLTKFRNQKDTAKENEEIHGPAFGSILARHFFSDPELALRHLTNDSRTFSDYSAYLTLAVTLWVWSLSGLRQQERFKDPNRGHLIYEQQATVELIEYGYMIHRRLLEQVNYFFKADEVLIARRTLIELEQAMEQASHFGEIRKLLNDNWRKLGLESLKTRIKEALSIREVETRLSERRLTEKLGLILMVLFGLVAVPSMANQVLDPIWKMLGFYRPVSNEAYITLLNVISLGFVLVVIYLLTRILRKRSSLFLEERSRE